MTDLSELRELLADILPRYFMPAKRVPYAIDAIVEVLNTRLSSARAEAIEEAARVAEHLGGDRAGEFVGNARGDDVIRAMRVRAKTIATAIRALSPAPSPAMDVERSIWQQVLNCAKAGEGMTLDADEVARLAALSQGEGK